MAQQQTQPLLDKVDPVWARIRREAEDIVRREPELASFIYSTILHHDALGRRHHLSAVGSARPCGSVRRVDPTGLCRCAQGYAVDRRLLSAPTSRRSSTATRRPIACSSRCCTIRASTRIQTHRLAHWLWGKGRRDFALYLQSRASAVFQCDIHPAAQIGRGIFLDHATGLVVGETAVIDDDVSMLHDVTLGGTGKQADDRHPKIRYGVMIGAGAKILGNIEVGHCARIAAGSVVLKSVPNNVTVAGVPAKVVGVAGCPEPARLHGSNALRRDLIAAAAACYRDQISIGA